MAFGDLHFTKTTLWTPAIFHVATVQWRQPWSSHKVAVLVVMNQVRVLRIANPCGTAARSQTRGKAIRSLRRTSRLSSSFARTNSQIKKSWTTSKSKTRSWLSIIVTWASKAFRSIMKSLRQRRTWLCSRGRRKVDQQQQLQMPSRGGHGLPARQMAWSNMSMGLPNIKAQITIFIIIWAASKTLTSARTKTIKLCKTSSK